MKRTILVVALLAFGAVAGAQTPASSPAKKELVAKVLQLQQPGIEGMARTLTQQPAAVMMQRAGNVLQARVPAEKREAVAREIQGDLKKYMDEAMPIVRDRALKLAPTTIGPLLEERFTEDELRQLIAIIESPVNRKFQQLGGEMQKALSDKLVAETRGAIDPKIRALEQSVAGRLGIQAVPPAPAASN